MFQMEMCITSELVNCVIIEVTFDLCGQLGYQ